MVIVDGPPAFENKIQFSRYPAMPFMIDRMNKTFSFYLDDYDRTGNKRLFQDGRRNIAFL
jgi:hypothetical protein